MADSFLAETDAFILCSAQRGHKKRDAFHLFSRLDGFHYSLLAGLRRLSPESRLRAGLEEAGLSPRMAGCMAKRMADRLTLAQLRKLQSLASLRKSHTGKISVEDMLREVRALQDPEIFAVTSTSALACVF